MGKCDEDESDGKEAEYSVHAKAGKPRLIIVDLRSDYQGGGRKAGGEREQLVLSHFCYHVPLHDSTLLFRLWYVLFSFILVP
ncbi:hypothetical protein A3A63_00750 [Candidatus Gottesmanbacteria bacterium RIFCSPLOWO2_01_FULL_46_9]|uniref:Uncharacterized protein n=1 Tax=Candidatus Gottesmanbacteria bacterium RIFCSPLOWO2_01_FULL_46_9 TaxID=1798394 RepID=A0A1F6B324_9BACT|nr:MAG: hypothetical protein A3A63_00750 [Candidatus Gottesmanbacteria bacterium RIFCSPLOWO2_01_FULL_46_9]